MSPAAIGFGAFYAAMAICIYLQVDYVIRVHGEARPEVRDHPRLARVAAVIAAGAWPVFMAYSAWCATRKGKGGGGPGHGDDTAAA